MLHDILKKSGIYSLSGLVTRGASFLMLPLYTRLLSPAEYGVMELLDLTTSVVGLLFGARVGSALFYYYFRAQTDRDRNQVLNDMLVFSLTLGLAILAITIPGSPYISLLVFGTRQYAGYFHLLFCGFACSIIIELGFSYIRALNQATLYVRLILAQTVSLAALNALLLMRFHLGVRSMLISNLITSAALVLFFIPRTAKPADFRFAARRTWDLFRYCIPLGLSGLAVLLIHYGDRAFLRSAVSLSELGVYALAYKFGMLIAVAHGPFNLYWTSQVCALMQKPDGERIYVRSTTALVAGLTFFALGLAFFSGPLVRVMAGPGFSGAASVIPWLAFAYVLRALGAHLQAIFTVEGRPDLELKVNLVGSILCVAAYAVLIPRFGVRGAVAATILGFGIILIYSYREAQKIRRFTFENAPIARLALLAMAITGGYYIVRPASPWMEAAVALGCLVIYPIGVWLFCIDAQDRALLRRMVAGTPPLPASLEGQVGSA